MLPLAAPPLGVNVAVNVTLSLAVSVSGKVSPLIEKAAPVTFACEMVTADPPTLVKGFREIAAVTHRNIAESKASWIGRQSSWRNRSARSRKIQHDRAVHLVGGCGESHASRELPFDVARTSPSPKSSLPHATSAAETGRSTQSPRRLNVAWVMLRSLAPLLESVTVVLWLDPTPDSEANLQGTERERTGRGCATRTSRQTPASRQQ